MVLRPAPKRRWFHWSLRLLCVVVTVPGMMLLLNGCGGTSTDRARIEDTERFLAELLGPNAVGMDDYSKRQFNEALQHVRKARKDSDFDKPECIMARIVVDPQDGNWSRVELGWLETRNTVAGVSIKNAEGKELVDGQINVQPFDSAFLADIGSTLYIEGAARLPLEKEMNVASAPPIPGEISVPILTVREGFNFPIELFASLVNSDGDRTEPIRVFVESSLEGRKVPASVR